MAFQTLIGALAMTIEELAAHINTHSYARPNPSILKVLLIAGLTVGIPLMIVIRNAGFALSKDTAVAQVRPARNPKVAGCRCAPDQYDSSLQR